MYLILDWDGTVTVRDTLWMLLERFGDREVFERMEGALGATHTHREVMEAEMATITTPLEEAVAFLVTAVEIRAGFRRVQLRKVRLSWKQFAGGDDFKKLPPTWDWCFAARAKACY